MLVLANRDHRHDSFLDRCHTKQERIIALVGKSPLELPIYNGEEPFTHVSIVSCLSLLESLIDFLHVNFH